MAYIDLEYLAEFATSYGYDLTAYTDAQKTAAINVAADLFLNVQYQWKEGVLDADPLDERVMQANALAAILHLKGRLFVDPASITASRVTGESKGVGPLSKSVTYADRQTYTHTYPTDMIDAMIRDLVVGGGLGAVKRW
jgi:hypothetical protein